MKDYKVRESVLPEETYYVAALSVEMAIRQAERLAGRPLRQPVVTWRDGVTFDAALVLGYVRLDHGEVAPEAVCPECGQPFGPGGVYVGFLSGEEHPEPFGPRCAACATQE